MREWKTPIDQTPSPTKNHCTCIGVVLRSCRSRSLFTRQNCLISDFYRVLSAYLRSYLSLCGGELWIFSSPHAISYTTLLYYFIPQYYYPTMPLISNTTSTTPPRKENTAAVTPLEMFILIPTTTIQFQFNLVICL